jgi:hypothetical protein
MRGLLFALALAAGAVQAADSAIERGLNQAGKAIERGAKASGRAVERAGRAVQKGGAKVHKKVDDAVRPKKRQ